MRFSPFGYLATQGTPQLVSVGSMDFTPASSNRYLSLAASSDWAVGTGDFTVEWFQYQTNNGNENFIFDLGTADNFAVSVASGGNRMNIYMNGTKLFNPTVSATTNVWYHVAVSRISSTLYIYHNGINAQSGSNSTNVTDNTSTFYIGCENPGGGTGDNWPGYITNFRFIKGTGLYSGSSLTVPTSTLQNVANTKLLLAVTDSVNFLTDSSTTPKTVTNNNSVAYNSLKPF